MNKMKNWKLIIMVVVIASLVVTTVGCKPTKVKDGEQTTGTPPDVTETETAGQSNGDEPIYKWGAAQEVSTWDDGGYFLPKEMAKKYADKELGQGEFYSFLLSPLFSRGVSENSRGQTFLPIFGGEPDVLLRNGDFRIDPDDQARLDQGEQLKKVNVVWLGHVPSLENEWGELVNANGERPEKEWIAFRFLVSNVNYGHPTQLIVNASGRLIAMGEKEYELLTLNLP